MSLAGRGVLVTRPAGMAAGLAERIERAGGRPIVFPAIAIEALPRPATLERLDQFALAIFVSPTAVERALATSGPWPRTLSVAAVGEGTRRALERAGFAEVLAPRDGADSEALLAQPGLAYFSGKPVLIVRGELAECYRRVLPGSDPAPLLAAWGEGKVHAVTVFSREALDNLVTLLGEARLGSAPLFVSHSRIAAHALRHGLPAIVGGPGDDAMVERLVAYFHE